MATPSLLRIERINYALGGVLIIAAALTQSLAPHHATWKPPCRTACLRVDAASMHWRPLCSWPSRSRDRTMSHKHLLFRSEAREKILRGATSIADAVRVTLGPRSKCVLIEKKWGKPIVCNDGVTIAKEFALKDPDENLGAQMLRGAAERTGDAVGDGTTTSTLLAHAIVAEGVRNIAAGASAGSVPVAAPADDVYLDAGAVSTLEGLIKDGRDAIEKQDDAAVQSCLEKLEKEREEIFSKGSKIKSPSRRRQLARRGCDVPAAVSGFPNQAANSRSFACSSIVCCASRSEAFARTSSSRV